MDRVSGGMLRGEKRPERIRVLQFGEGNFLRAFVDRMIDDANAALGLDMAVAVVQPIARGMTDVLREQDGLYTVLLRGSGERDAHIVQCVRRAIDPYREYQDYLALAHERDLRFIVSNTTEAGIVYTGADAYDDAPPASFPGKLTRFLYERFTAGLPGLVMLPCELSDHNAENLRECVQKTAAQWALGNAFGAWLDNECVFCPTLVDRIVTGYPKEEARALCEEFGYEDKLLVTAETFGLWVIQAPDWVRAEFPLDKAGCPVLFAEDVTPYKVRKVRVLNGSHTLLASAAFLCGLDTVGDCMRDERVRAFSTRALDSEIVPLVPLPRAEVEVFAGDVIKRFENPANKHLLSSIALNAVSKYQARVLPTMEEYAAKHGEPPRCLAFGLASLIMLYAGARMNDRGAYEGIRAGEPFEILDDPIALRAFSRLSCDMPPEMLAYAALSDQDVWGRDLREILGLEDMIAAQLSDIMLLGARAAMDKAREWDGYEG